MSCVLQVLHPEQCVKDSYGLALENSRQAKCLISGVCQFHQIRVYLNARLGQILFAVTPLNYSERVMHSDDGPPIKACLYYGIFLLYDCVFLFTVLHLPAFVSYLIGLFQ